MDISSGIISDPSQYILHVELCTVHWAVEDFKALLNGKLYKRSSAQKEKKNSGNHHFLLFLPHFISFPKQVSICESHVHVFCLL